MMARSKKRPSAGPAKKKPARPRYTLDEKLEDLTDLHTVRSKRFAFYPSRSEYWHKARQLGIPKKAFDAWADRRRWYGELDRWAAADS